MSSEDFWTPYVVKGRLWESRSFVLLRKETSDVMDTSLLVRVVWRTKLRRVGVGWGTGGSTYPSRL